MNLNQNAIRIAEEMMARHEELNIKCRELENGAKIIDCGIEATGSFEAARLFVKACLGGLGEIKFSFMDLGVAFLPCIQVWSDSPVVACIASQKAGWRVEGEGFSALGSGPARILAKKPKETLEEIGYEESSDSAVIALECSKYPGEEIAEGIAEACGIKTEDLYILTTRTSSLVGSVQVSARAIETALFKMDALGLDYKGIQIASSVAPVAPVVGDDSMMMGVTNDMVIYGSRVYMVYSGSEGIDVANIPSEGSLDYGKHFIQIFEDAGGDFYKIDPMIFAPAEVYINDLSTKNVEGAGKIDPEMIEKSVLG